MRKLRQLADLSGRTVLITGGAGHLGRSFGEALAELGANVALADRNEEAAREVALGISKEYGVNAVGVYVDLADGAQVATLPSKVHEMLGGLDILINNAGFVGTDKLVGWCVPFQAQSLETWRAAVEVNMTAPFFLTQAAYPFLAESGKSSVINLGSIYGFLGPDMRIYGDTGMGNPCAYAASKGGLIQLTRWLATVLAPTIRVNSVSPGGVFRNQNPAFLKAYENRTPMGRMASEEDLKGVIAFLASDLSAYVTGQHIAVDGGWSAW